MSVFLDLAKQRYSCRSYDGKSITKEQIEQILEAARIAPSAVNAQPWHFVVATQLPLRENLVSCYSRPWLATAPAIIVACGDHSVSWRRADGKDHCDIDIAIAVDHITLAAAEMGLATCWICKFDAIKCAEFLKLPSHVSPIVMIPIGYPNDKSADSDRHLKRKTLDQIVHGENF